MIQINNTNTPQTLNLKLEDSVEISTELVKNGSFNEIDLTELVQNGSFSQLGTDLIGNGEFDELGTDVITNGGFTGATELIDNGTFTTDLAFWSSSSWWVWNALGAYHPSTSLHKPLYQEACEIGKTYLITFDLNCVGLSLAKFSLGSSSGSTTQVIDQNLPTGSYSYVVTAAAEYVVFNRQNTAEYYVNNVSVKEEGEDWTNGTGWSFGEDKAISTQALGSEEVTNGDFTGVTNIVLDGDFPLPNVNWIVAATTTINGGSATFEGLGTVSDADVLAAAFVVRVEADGGIVEAESCLISDLTFLTVNP